MKKTIEDITLDDVADLVEAAIDLLGMSRMLIWLESRDDDGSYKECQGKMENVLSQIGLPQLTYQEFVFNLEGLLRTKSRPSKPIGKTHKA